MRSSEGKETGGKPGGGTRRVCTSRQISLAGVNELGVHPQASIGLLFVSGEESSSSSSAIGHGKLLTGCITNSEGGSGCVIWIRGGSGLSWYSTRDSA